MYLEGNAKYVGNAINPYSYVLSNEFDLIVGEETKYDDIKCPDMSTGESYEKQIEILSNLSDHLSLTYLHKQQNESNFPDTPTTSDKNNNNSVTSTNEQVVQKIQENEDPDPDSLPSLTQEVTSPSGCSASSSISIDQDTSDEFARLKSVLTLVDPVYLKEELLRSLRSKDYSKVLSLSNLLPESRFKKDTLHCVRCHKEFNENYGDKTCIIPHRKRDISIISEDKKVVVYQCDRCFCLFKLEHGVTYSKTKFDVRDCGACFIGRHTIFESEVDYDVIAKSCSDNGCVEFYV